MIKYPDDNASNSIKRSKDFGLDVVEMCYDTISDSIPACQTMVDTLRQYARGEQNTLQYKKSIEGEEIEGVLKSYKIDYSQPLKILPPYIDILTNAIDESLFKPRAEAVDEVSVYKKKKHFDKLDRQFYGKELDAKMSQVVGMNLVAPDVPEDEAELEARKTEFKPNIELAQELLIESVFKENRLTTLKSNTNKDLAILGVGVGKHYLDRNKGVVLQYIDPKYWFTNRFEYEDGRDIRYHVLVEQQATIYELQAMADRQLTQDELDKLKKISGADTPYENTDADNNRIVKYVYVAYKTKLNRVYKKLRKNKVSKLIDRTKDGYNPSNPNKKIVQEYETWFEGIYIPDANILISWKQMSNQAMKNVNGVYSPFVVYAPNVKRKSERGYWRFYSIVQRAIPIVDDLNRDYFKLQQLKMELRPNTVRISPSALKQVVLNAGDEPLDPNVLLNLFFGRGLLLADEYNEDGERIGEPIKEYGGGIQNNAIMLLAQEFANSYNRLRQLLGVNELRDGTTMPNSKTSVTVQKLLLASSNNATNHIVKGSFDISVQFAEAVSSHLYDIMTTKPLKQKYLTILGRQNMDLLNSIKENPMARYSIYFDFRPDNDDRIAFEQSLINEYSRGAINSAQYNKVRMIGNVKNAVKYLEYLIKNNEDKVKKEKQDFMQQQAIINQQSAVTAQKAKQETVTIEYETKRQLELVKAQIQAEKDKRDAQLKELLNQSEFERELTLKQLELEIIKGKEAYKQDRIDGRVIKTGTIQSKLIKQRKTDGDPIDFEKEMKKIFDNPLKIAKSL